jgi:predicted nucleic acid-binding protein
VTASLIVDASAIVAMLFNEPARDKVASRLRGHAIYAPELLSFEVANACIKKIRSRPAEQDDLLAALSTLYDLPIVFQEIDMQQAVMLAWENGLSLYDASYLWLALDLGTELVTLDEKLDRAYRRLAKA